MKESSGRAHHYKQRVAVLLAVFGMAAGMIFTPGGKRVTAQGPETRQALLDQKQVALERVAARQGLQLGDLQVVNSTVSRFPLQSLRTSFFKVRDNRSGEVYGMMLDASGQEIDAEQLHTNEEAARRAKYGKLEPALAEQLALAGPGKPVEVSIWLRGPSDEEFENPRIERTVPGGPQLTREDVDARYQQAITRRASLLKPLLTSFIGRLSKAGHNVTAESLVPRVRARLRPDVIREIEGWDEVEQIYLFKLPEPSLDTARGAIRADVVHTRGFEGTGVRVAQVEVGGRVASNNPNLGGMHHDLTFTHPNVNAHSTAVAGIIRSTHATIRGIAPRASLGAFGFCTDAAACPTMRTTDYQTVSNRAITWGARALNISWNIYDGVLTPGDYDRFYDRLVIDHARSVIVSSGNRGGAGCPQGTDGNVASPALAYNIVTVGAFNDQNTAAWDNDPMYTCSSWVDPTSTDGDREKPEVVAPGQDINSTTTADPWTGNVGSGTSYAAPMVTGLAALMIQRNIDLEVSPEALKSILMVTAVHNIEGATELSDRDGTGAVVADRADDVSRDVTGSWGEQSYTCGASTFTQLATMSLTAGVRTRVALAWLNNPSYSQYANRPGADLDIDVLDPSGALVSGLYSVDNNYEIQEFIPATTGTYRLRAYRFRCNYNPQWLGWAWHQGN